MTKLEVDTPHGRANAHVRSVDEPRAALVLGHGAAGGVTSRDLVAVTDVARSEGFSVALIEQPYRVAGRRAPAPAHPWDEPGDAVHGRAAIVANWLEDRDDPDSWTTEYCPWRSRKTVPSPSACRVTWAPTEQASSASTTTCSSADSTPKASRAFTEIYMRRGE